MDLLKSVCTKNKKWDFEEYISFLKANCDSQLESLKNDIEWKLRDSLTNKVTSKGELRPFFGDTVTIPLKEKYIETYSCLQNHIYKNIPFLSERINSKTFHITVHDLFNQPAEKTKELASQMEKNEKAIIKIFKKISMFVQVNPELSSISFKAYKLYPGHNIALVVGMLPSTEKDFRLLLNLYCLFEHIICLPYMLKPHVTLAYFKPIIPFEKERKLLYNTIASLDLNNLSIKLDISSLAYQVFSDMKNYKTIFTPRDFL